MSIKFTVVKEHRDEEGRRVIDEIKLSSVHIIEDEGAELSDKDWETIKPV